MLLDFQTGHQKNHSIILQFLNILYQTQIQTLNSSYFENKGSGHFITKPLPKAFQWSSVEALLVFDFDDDGYLDLIKLIKC